jgi:tetratricopeptide (TPR) repeat protein
MQNQKINNEIEKGINLFSAAKYEETIIHFEKLKKETNNFLIYWYLGHTYYKIYNSLEAIKCIKESIKLKSEDSLNLFFLGELYLSTNKYKLAIENFKKVLEIDHKNEAALISLARVFIQTGDFKKSNFYYKLLIEYYPLNFEAHYEYYKIKKDHLSHNLINRIELELESQNINFKNKIFGKLIIAENEKLNKNYELEIKYLLDSHSTYIEKKNLAAKQEWNYLTNLLPQFMAKLQEANIISFKTKSKLRPIFIMGPPRSGTTLVENIIVSGKNKINSGGEVESLGKTFYSENIIKDYNSNKIKVDLSQKEIERIYNGIVYQYEQLGLIDKSKDNIFTDKSLENFLYIDLIKKIFPNAKFIFCYRDPVANVIGIIKNFLPNIFWAHSLDKIFIYLDMYYQILKKVNSDKNCLIISLEELSKNPIDKSKKLYNFLDLNWSSDCINFHNKKNNPIKTLSNIQLRNKIKKHDLSYLQNYKNIFYKDKKKYEWFKF